MNEELNKTIYWTQKIFAFANNYLSKEGWFNQNPINNNGPTPWFTYPAISFLEDIITKDFRVFEYGSGFSTLYFANKAKEVHSVDHNLDWVEKITAANSNTNVVYCEQNLDPLPSSGSYIDEFKELDFECPLCEDNNHNIEHGLLNLEFARYATQILNWDRGYFDIIVIDGMARQLSGYIATKCVSDNGFIILDNSNRWQYNSLQNHLIKNGFGRIDFWGPGPSSVNGWCTSFFSKSFELVNRKINRPKGSGDLGW